MMTGADATEGTKAHGILLLNGCLSIDLGVKRGTDNKNVNKNGNKNMSIKVGKRLRPCEKILIALLPPICQ